MRYALQPFSHISFSEENQKSVGDEFAIWYRIMP
jgi:hypothetical protein